MIKKSLPCIVLLVALTAASGYSQCSYTFQPGSDEGIDAVCHRHPLCDIAGNPCDTTNRGDSKHIYASARQKGGILKIMRSFVKLDLSNFGEVAADALPTKATLDLYFYRNAAADDEHIFAGGSNAFYIERVVEDWREDTIRWQYPVSSGNLRMPDVEFNAGPENRILVPATTSPTQDVQIDMTEMISFWLANPDKNFGFRIRLADESAERQVHFCSSDYADAQFRPKVSIDFPKVVANAGDDVLICKGTTGRLYAQGGASYEWFPLLPSNDILSRYDAQSPFLKATKTQFFEVEATTGTCKSRDTVFVDYGEPKAASITTPSSDVVTVCEGEDVNFAASGGTFFKWFPAEIFDNDVSPNPVASPTRNTMVFVEAISAGDKCPGRDSVELKILKNTVATVRVDPTDRTICAGDTAKIDVLGGLNWEWSPGKTLNDSTKASVIATPTVTTEYVVITSGTNSCPDYDTIRIEVSANVPVNAGGDRQMCSGDTIQLEATGTGTFLWTNGETLSDPLNDTTLAYPTVTTQYIVSLFGSGNCTGSDTVMVTVDPVPDVKTNITDTTICAEDEVTLSATGALKWWWSTGETSDKIVVKIDDVNTETVFQIVGSDSNCSSDTLLIRLKTQRCSDPYVIVPKYFSPNGDGVRDRFVVQDIDRYDNEVIVINKWGDIVYRADNYDNRWDGTYYGQTMAEDTYMYLVRVKVDDDWIDYKGTVTLLRGKR